MITHDLVYPVIIFLICSVILWVYIHQICFFIISIYTARRSMYRKVDQITVAPGVSVIKPLMGLDSCLKENLISHFTLDYPKVRMSAVPPHDFKVYESLINDCAVIFDLISL
ncbi:hypothetical protein FGIG_09678 [Fasciola gigantica]|uniref:Uncharacterized protein n=1 Tax=Fasciola gigantica TaxID=46835 RepID=A0A504YMB8_FASGI|nr:hypothetical protein FGIG_09678 [Fasciola gigantica]